MISQISQAVDFIQRAGATDPEVGVILGTGLGNRFVTELEDKLVIPYDDIPNFPTATVEHHHGKLIYGTIGGKRILTMQGRFHYYEGYSMQQITLPVRVMKAAGVRLLLVSNAAGNLRRDWTKGELMLLEDHIDLLPDNPLRGPNLDEFGPRFPDMSRPYSRELNSALLRIAGEENIRLNAGVYASVSGPNLETRAEYRYLQRIGADAVGMSTVPEVIVANHMGLPVCAVSVLTDDCDPENLNPVELPEIIAAAGRAEPLLTRLFSRLIKQLP